MVLASLAISALGYPQYEGGAQSFSSFSAGPITTQGGLGLGALGQGSLSFGQGSLGLSQGSLGFTQGSLGLSQGSLGFGQGSFGLAQSPLLVQHKPLYVAHKPVLLHKEVEVEHYVSIELSRRNITSC